MIFVDCERKFTHILGHLSKLERHPRVQNLFYNPLQLGGGFIAIAISTVAIGKILRF